METTSSTWTFEEDVPLLACGVDSEQIERFRGMDLEGNPMPLVFTDREVARAAASERPERVLCACYCCKEAVLKALKEPYDFADCELILEGAADRERIGLAEALMARRGISRAVARILPEADGEEEVTLVVYLFGF